MLRPDSSVYPRRWSDWNRNWQNSPGIVIGTVRVADRSVPLVAQHQVVDYDDVRRES